MNKGTGQRGLKTKISGNRQAGRPGFSLAKGRGKEPATGPYRFLDQRLEPFLERGSEKRGIIRDIEGRWMEDE